MAAQQLPQSCPRLFAEFTAKFVMCKCALQELTVKTLQNVPVKPKQHNFCKALILWKYKNYRNC